jgi:predicted methyltransferase
MRSFLFALGAAVFAFSGSAVAGPDPARLAEVLAAQPEEVQARYVYRHPQETLEFFEVSPGGVVVEALPGRGWYTKILSAYVGPQGKVVGVDYSRDMFPLFGFFSDEQLKAKETWKEDWVAGTAEWGIENGASISAFVFGEMPVEMKGTVDTVLFIRALHNLARFEDQGGFLTTALQNAFDVLKPGGIAGVVQHQARDGMPDDWAGGRNGYLKDDFVIRVMSDAGFEYLGMSEVNHNEKDQPTVDDLVWRLPPTLLGARDNPELKAEREAIGESNRMTLKFRKPE